MKTANLDPGDYGPLLQGIVSDLPDGAKLIPDRILEAQGAGNQLVIGVQGDGIVWEPIRLVLGGKP